MAKDLPEFSLFIGVGHTFRCDDGVGPWLATRLAAGGFNAVSHAGDGVTLMEYFAKADDILIADATQSQRAAGSVILLDAIATPLPPHAFRNSTHEFGLGYAVETARALGALPKSLWIIGIEGKDFSFGEGLSAPVAQTAGLLFLKLMVRTRALRP